MENTSNAFSCLKIKKTVVKSFLKLFTIASTWYITFLIYISYDYNTSLVGFTNKYLVNTSGCRIPDIDPFHFSVSKFYHKPNEGPKNCGQTEYLEVKGNKVFLNHTALMKDFGNVAVNCIYKSILRNPYNYTLATDYKIGFGRGRPLRFGQPIKYDFITVKCLSGKTELFTDYIAFVRLKPRVEERCNNRSHVLSSERLNIVFVGIDSVSRLNFIRHLKTTYDYLLNTLGAFELGGYTKVGDNTFPNIIPLLTGHFYSFYGSADDVSHKFVDDFDFIWKEYSKVGYRTMLSEDFPDIATFDYHKWGFKYQPTDYYMRPFTIAVEYSPWRKKDGRFCFHSIPEFKYFYNYLLLFEKVMDRRPHFTFLFCARLTHDHLNNAGYLDQPSLELLQNFKETGVLNKSVVIFFSDHGIRYGKILETYVGKVEERMPFMFLLFPEWFLKSHPDIAKNLEINQRRLTTPFDIHATLVDLLSMVSSQKIMIRKTPGMSLFTEIPERRTCEDANISAHWCTCHYYRPIPVSDSKVLQAAEAVINTINGLLNDKICTKLKVHQVLDAQIYAPSVFMLKRPEAFYITEHYFDYLSNTMGNSLDFMITLSVLPSNAIFESTVRFYKGFFNVQGEISRINRYDSQADCITNFQLKKFCFCRDYTA